MPRVLSWTCSAIACASIVSVGCSGDDCNTIYSEACGSLSPQVQILDPKPGASVSGEVIVRARISSRNALVRIQGFVDGTSFYDGSSGGDVEFTFTSNTFTQTNHTVRVTAVDDQNLYGSDRVVVFIADGRPVPDSGVIPPPRDAGFFTSDTGVQPFDGGAGDVGFPDSGVFQNPSTGFDPGRVYYLGGQTRVNAGEPFMDHYFPRFVCEMDGELGIWGGFTFETSAPPLIRPTDGAIIYMDHDLGMLMEFRIDRLARDVNFGSYLQIPAGWYTNDIEIPLAACQGVEVSNFKIHPRTGAIYYWCGLATQWHEVGGGPVSLCGGGEVDALSSDDARLCRFGEIVEDANGMGRTVMTQDADGNPVRFVDVIRSFRYARARPSDGFWVVTQGADEGVFLRWTVDAMGMATLDGEYAPVPDLVAQFGTGSASLALDEFGNLYVSSLLAESVARLDGNFSTAIVLFDPPRGMIDCNPSNSEMLTGP